MTRAVQYEEVGGPEVLRVNEVAEPVAGPGEIAIQVEAAGVNPIDVKLRSGQRASAPFAEARGTGADGAGLVTGVGADVDGFRPGDPVVFANASGRPIGSYATDVVVAATDVTLRPAGVSAEQGAAVPIPAGTAYQSLRSLAVREGDTLLIHGGSGAVGQAAIQFARAWGATVIASTSDRRADRVAALGATPVLYGDGLVERVRALGEVSVVLDCAGTDEALDQSLELLDDRSRIATIVRGADAASLGIRAFSGGSPEPLTPRQLSWRSEAVAVTLAMIAGGAFDLELGERYGLDGAADAHRAIAAGATGKLIIEP